MDDMKWSITGKSTRQCWNCGKETNLVSIAFEAPMCSEECDDVKIREYNDYLMKQTGE